MKTLKKQILKIKQWQLELEALMTEIKALNPEVEGNGKAEQIKNLEQFKKETLIHLETLKKHQAFLTKIGTKKTLDALETTLIHDLDDLINKCKPIIASIEDLLIQFERQFTKKTLSERFLKVKSEMELLMGDLKNVQNSTPLIKPFLNCKQEIDNLDLNESLENLKFTP